MPPSLGLQLVKVASGPRCPHRPACAPRHPLLRRPVPSCATQLHAPLSRPPYPYAAPLPAPTARLRRRLPHQARPPLPALPSALPHSFLSFSTYQVVIFFLFLPLSYAPLSGWLVSPDGTPVGHMVHVAAAALAAMAAWGVLELLGRMRREAEEKRREEARQVGEGARCGAGSRGASRACACACLRACIPLACATGGALVVGLGVLLGDGLVGST
jgi:hypothetical protein